MLDVTPPLEDNRVSFDDFTTKSLVADAQNQLKVNFGHEDDQREFYDQIKLELRNDKKTKRKTD